MNGKYQVSTEGNVRSMRYNNTNVVRNLKPKINRFGFLEVKLSKNNKTKDYMVARLVAQAFIPNPYNKEEVVHKSKNKTDNRAKNLKWAHHSESKHNDYNKGKRKGNSTHSKITISGKNFKNYEEVRKYYGIKNSTFWHRLNVYKWNIFEAAEIPVGERIDNNEK